MYNLTEGFNLKKFDSGFNKQTRRAKQMTEFDQYLSKRLNDQKLKYLKFTKLKEAKTGVQEENVASEKTKVNSLTSASHVKESTSEFTRSDSQTLLRQGKYLQIFNFLRFFEPYGCQ